MLPRAADWVRAHAAERRGAGLNDMKWANHLVASRNAWPEGHNSDETQRLFSWMPYKMSWGFLRRYTVRDASTYSIYYQFTMLLYIK